MNLALSDARYRTACATSSGSIHGTGSRLPAERSAICRGVSRRDHRGGRVVVRHEREEGLGVSRQRQHSTAYVLEHVPELSGVGR
jgi:hypothetical protein